MELYQQTAHEAADLIARGETSAQQVTEACLERIAEVEETVNSFLVVTATVPALRQCRPTSD